AYWVGCSTGGRQAMVMSQNFPAYFDGIVAGDPVYDLQAISLSTVWGVDQIYDLSPGPYTTVPEPAPEAPAPIIYANFPASDQTLFETALLQTCDGLDGVADGVIDNLPACLKAFDPATATYISNGVVYPLQCPAAKDATCLSPAQIQAVMRINRGPRNARGQTIEVPAGLQAPDHVDATIEGYQYDAGFMSTASIPLRKIGRPGGAPGDYALGLNQFPYAWISPPNPSYDPLAFNFGTDLGLLSKATPVVSYSTSADISKFIARGNKIIWYHGLSDPGPPVLGTILYYREMAAQHGGIAAAQRFSRLYLVPNMGHCSGGPATDQFDMLTPLVQWVENGVSPGPVPATGTNFTPALYQVDFVPTAPTRTRPLCPYPQEARYTGPTGSGLTAGLASLSNYSCIMPPAPPH
ncbi:MAG: tannase/feruloyl esterase family alpha/beta hydrolase, partial [Stellaceae bacterium]